MLEREELDVVDIVLPSHLHYEVATAVLNSGRHLLLEKPMAIDLAQCTQLVALAATGVACAAGCADGVAAGAAPTWVTGSTTRCGALRVMTRTPSPVHSDAPSVTRACAR